MDVFFHAASQMAILFILLIVGMVARRLRLMNDRFDTMLSQLVMNIALPAMILSSVLTNDNLPDAQTIWLLIGCSFISYTIIIAIAELVPRLYRGKSAASQGTHSFIIAFGNVGFIGFPVLSAIFGPAAVFYGAVYNIPYNVALFSIGEAMIKRREDAEEPRIGVLDRVKAIARSLANPCMVACVLAIVLALAKITDAGGIIGTSCSYLGQLTVPASMLIIGSSLAKMSLKSMVSHLTPYISALFRLLVVPLVVFAVFRLFIGDALVLGVITVSSAMPVASVGTMMCLVHGGDVDTMMRGTFLTTVLSLLTIPLIALLVV